MELLVATQTQNLRLSQKFLESADLLESDPGFAEPPAAFEFVGSVGHLLREVVAEVVEI